MATTLTLHDRAKVTLDETIRNAEQFVAGMPGGAEKLAPLVIQAKANAANCDRIVKAFAVARQEIGERAISTAETVNYQLTGRGAVRVVYHLAQEG